MRINQHLRKRRINGKEKRWINQLNVCGMDGCKETKGWEVKRSLAEGDTFLFGGFGVEK